jgi:hypothetical protein
MRTSFQNLLIAFLISITFFITNFGSTTYCAFQKPAAIQQSHKMVDSTYTVRVFHDGFWWIQIYDSGSDTLITEILDPDQS